MAGLGSLCRRRLVAWTGAVAVVPQFVGRPAICVGRDGIFDLLLVTLGRRSLYAVRVWLHGPTFRNLTTPRRLDVDVFRHAVHAAVLERVWQLSLIILGIVARLVLPSVAFVARDRVAVVVGEAAYAADLAIVSGVAVDCEGMVALLIRGRMEESRVSREIVTVDRLDRKRGVCHAISSVGERVQVR
jgi:hypothetical protein